MALIVSDDYESMVKKWVVAERQLKMINEKTKELREIKTELSDKISNYLENHNIKQIETSEGKIVPIERKEYTTLTYNYLEKSLGKMISDPAKVQQIVAYLKNNREVVVKKELQFRNK
jgi:nitrogenase molybdenum-iron protein alpha/beta subunit